MSRLQIRDIDILQIFIIKYVTIAKPLTTRHKTRRVGLVIYHSLEYKHLDPADVVKLTNLWVVTCGQKAGIYTDM